MQIVERMPFHQAIYLVSVLHQKAGDTHSLLHAPPGWRLLDTLATSSLCLLPGVACTSGACSAPAKAVAIQAAAATTFTDTPSLLSQVVTTLTTVGFGDVVAQTMLGRAVIILTICFGVVAIPVQVGLAPSVAPLFGNVPGICAERARAAAVLSMPLTPSCRFPAMACLSACAVPPTPCLAGGAAVF